MGMGINKGVTRNLSAVLAKKPSSCRLEFQYCETLNWRLEWPTMRSDLHHASVMDPEFFIEQCNFLHEPTDFRLTQSLRESAAQDRE